MKFNVNKAHHRREVYRLALRDYREAVKTGKPKHCMREGACNYIHRGLGMDWWCQDMKEIYGYTCSRGGYVFIAPKGELEPRVRMLEEIVASMPEPTLLQRIELLVINWFRK